MNNLRRQSDHRWIVTLIAIAFFLLATTYSFVTPIFEAPDELWHYPFVWHLARTGQLPVQDPNQPQLWGQEGSQPPLYYALAAMITAPIPADDLPALIYRNPHADLGLVSADGNANIVVHTAREAWPWRGAVLAIHVARLFSVFLGTGTVLAVYALGRVLWPERPALALLAMSFVAFNPMFLFISGSVNNDNLITLLASLTLWRLVSLVMSNSPGPEQTQEICKEAAVWPFVSLGTLTGFAALAKVSGLGLVGLVGLTLLWWGGRRRAWRTVIIGNGLVSLLAVAIAGWWYWRNIKLYGDWSGTENMIAMMGGRPVSPTLAQLLAETPGLLRSFWGLFGYFSVPMPSPLYWLLNLLLVVGLVGLLVGLLFSRAKTVPSHLGQTWPILVVWLILMFIGLVQWTLRTPASQGRLLFPALAALASPWAAGWLALTPPRWLALPGLVMLVLAVWVPWGVIAPAYARPAPVTTLPASAQSLAVTFGDAVHLLAYENEMSTIQPGQTLPLTLYWCSEKPIETDYTVFIHLLDENDLIVAQRDVFHGPGLYPTSQWVAGQTFGDTYVLRVPRTAFAPAQARFAVGLYHHTTGVRLPTSTGRDSFDFGQVELHSQPGQFPNPQALQFEDHISLVGYAVDRRRVTVGDRVTLTLYWQSGAVPERNYKIFVHLVGDGEARAAQHDSEPQSGTAPTSSWIPGQVVIDAHPLTITPNAPPGAYRLIVGLYEGDTGRRLRLLRDQGTSVQADSVTLSGIRVITP